MSHNEDSTASLGHSEVLSVQHSVGDMIPEFSQRPDKGTKVAPSPGAVHAGDVFPHKPAGSQATSQSEIRPEKLTTRVVQSASLAGDGERLAGSSPDKNINVPWAERPVFVAIEVSKVRHTGESGGKHPRRKRLNLAVADAGPAKPGPGEVGRANARADREETKAHSLHLTWYSVRSPPRRAVNARAAGPQAKTVVGPLGELALMPGGGS